MAMAVVPAAANAQDPALPVITFNDVQGDIDKDNTNGLVQWVKGSISFTIQQELKPGTYTFKAWLKNHVGVDITILDKTTQLKPCDGQDGRPSFEEGQEIELDFTVEEATTGLEIKVQGLQDYEEGSNYDYFIGFKPGDENFEAGLSFSQKNFTNGVDAPLDIINKAVDNYVELTKNFGSEDAKLLMTSFKEKVIQSVSANPENLTYADYVKYELYEDDLTQTPLYEGATRTYNAAVRIEAEWQAAALEAKIQEALDATKDDKGDVNPYLEEMAKKVQDKIDTYKQAAADETEAELDEKGEPVKEPLFEGEETPLVPKAKASAPAELDPKTLEEEGFDIVPTLSPLKDIKEEIDALVNPGNAAALASGLQVSYAKIDALKADLKAKYDEIAAADTKYKVRAEELLAAANQFADHYKGIIDDTKDEIDKEIDAKPIADIDDEFKAKMLAQLKVSDDNVDADDTYFKDFYAIYQSYKDAVAAANGTEGKKPELDENGLKYFGEDTQYEARSAKFDEELAAAKGKFVLPDLKDNTNPKIKVYDKTGAEVEVDYKTATTTTVTGAQVDSKYVADFTAYVNALNALGEAYAKLEEQQAKADKVYEDNPNEEGYDNRDFYKETFNNYWGKDDKNANNADIWTDITYVTSPGVANVNATPKQEQGEFTSHEDFLKKLKEQLEERWGTWDNGDYGYKKNLALHAYYDATDDVYLRKSIREFIDKLVKTDGTGTDYSGRASADERYFLQLIEKKNLFDDAVKKLRERIANSPIYSANPKIYLDLNTGLEQTYYELDEEGNETTTELAKYDLSNYQNEGTPKTWKEILVDFETLVKQFDSDYKKALDKKDKENYDNYNTKVHATRLWQLNKDLGEYVDVSGEKPELKDDILKQIEEFVKKGGVIDQQEKAYGENAAEDNYTTLSTKLTEIVSALNGRIGANQADGYSVDDDADGEYEYYVGYEVPDATDASVLVPEVVGLEDLEDIKAYNSTPEQPISLTKENIDALKRLLDEGIKVKYTEANEILTKWTTNADDQLKDEDGNPIAKDNWTRTEYEKANAELGKAILLVNEVNEKLEKEFEPKLAAEAKAQYELKTARAEIDKDSNVEDKDARGKWQISQANWNKLKFGNWNNGRDWSSKLFKKIYPKDAKKLRNTFVNPLTEFEADPTYQLRDKLVELKPGNEDQTYNAAKESLHKNDQPLFETLEGIYSDILAYRASLDQAYRDQNVKETFDASKLTTLKDIEGKITKFVDDMVKENENIKANEDALTLLKEFCNVDNNDNFDWDDLISGIGTKTDPYAVLKSLMETTGIKNIIAVDNDAEKVLEPTKVDENGNLVNLHTFQEMLANPEEREKIEKTIIAAARALRANADESEEATKKGGALYEQLKTLLQQILTAYADRDLDDKISDFSEKFETLATNIINIDQHAQANKDQHQAMQDAAASLEEKIQAKKDELIGTDTKPGSMPSSSAKEAVEQALNNFLKEALPKFEDLITGDYEEGKAWEEDVIAEEAEALADLSKAYEAAMNTANGTDGTIAEKNAEDWKKFQSAYQTANQEFAVLIKKLNQLKNLDNDVKESVRTSANNATNDAVEYLFGKVTGDWATINSFDELDKIYQKGLQELAALGGDDAVEPWDNSNTDDIKTIQDNLQKHIKAVDDVVKAAVNEWKTSYAQGVYDAAKAAFEGYSIYKAEYEKANAVENDPKTEANETEAAIDKAIKAIITANQSFNYLYTKTKAIDDKTANVRGEKKVSLGGFETYAYGNNDLIDINELFDILTEMKADDFYNTELTAGKDAEAIADLDTYKTYADSHLADDQAGLEGAGYTIEDDINGHVFENVLSQYAEIFEKDGEEKPFNAVNHDELVDQIEGIVGKKVWDEEKSEFYWDETGQCAFVHQLLENVNAANQAAYLATADALQGAIESAENDIRAYQVYPKFIDQIQGLKDEIEQLKKDIQSEEWKKTKNIAKEVDEVKKKFGTVDDEWLGYNDLDKDYENVLGTKDAEDGYLPDLIFQAFNAEKDRLKADINTMRAEFKTYLEGQGKDLDKKEDWTPELTDLNETIEGYWTEVNSATRKMVTETKTDENNKNPKKSFVEYTYPDLTDLKAGIEETYKDLRTKNNSAIDADALVAQLNARLAAVEAAAVQDKNAAGEPDPNYIAGAPEVQKKQEIVNDRVQDAREYIAASDDKDYDQEMLTDMVINAENALAARDEAADKVSGDKAYVDKELADLEELIPESQEKVNEKLVNEYDLTEFYAEATEQLEGIKTAVAEALAAYDFKTAAALVQSTDEAVESYNDAITDAEDAAAANDLTKRMAAQTAQVNLLKLRLEANGFDEETYEKYLEALNDIEAAIEVQELALEASEHPMEDYDGISSEIGFYTEDEDGEKIVTPGSIQESIDEWTETIGNTVPGDIDGNGRVTLYDVNQIIDYAMGVKELPVAGSELYQRLDVNGDGYVNTTDATCAVFIVLYGNIYGPDGAPEVDEARSLDKANNSVSVSASKTEEGLTRLAINLSNTTEFDAFQMDLQLPEGMKLAVASLSDRANSQFLRTNVLEDGTLRIAAMSYKNEAFAGNDGAVLNLYFEVADGAQDEFARFNNVFFVSKGHQVDFELGGVTPTGIQSANAETALGQKIYDLGGRMKSSLKKGVNIIKDAAGNAKKVFKK